MVFSPTVPYKKLKSTKAWRLTSLFVRLISRGKCYTCKKIFPIGKLAAGHFLEKLGSAAIYFDLDGLRAQCNWSCNRMARGRKDEYALNLIKEIGLERVEALRKKARKSKVWTQAELDLIVKQREEDIEKIKKTAPL